MVALVQKLFFFFYDEAVEAFFFQFQEITYTLSIHEGQWLEAVTGLEPFPFVSRLIIFTSIWHHYTLCSSEPCGGGTLDGRGSQRHRHPAPLVGNLRRAPPLPGRTRMIPRELAEQLLIHVELTATRHPVANLPPEPPVRERKRRCQLCRRNNNENH